MSTPNVMDGIAIIGLAGRFPGARDVRQFWENLCAGRESIATFTDEELRSAGVTPAEYGNPAYVRRRAVLDEPEWFDAGFFGLTAREAELTDPQHRVFLECCWQAFEDSGQHPQGAGSVGVFASSSLNTYLLRQVLGSRAGIADFTKVFQADAYNVLIGGDKDYLATRVAYKMNLRGPALTIQAACSSSLVAVAQACAGLQAYHCDVALAGGVSISFPQERGHLYQEGAIASADGHCRAFDAEAKGTVFGAGCGVVLLKRLDEALRDGNHIYGVIRAAALNNDGAGKMSFTAPSQEGQADVIALAHALADVSAESLSYVEAHGTGTPLGDPIEVAALTQAFRVTTDKKGFCGLGSLKTNVGHLEAAAGVTGLIKVALAMKHRFLPASLHFQTPNPNIDFAESPFHVVSTGRPWESGALPRRAGLSSFGVGGTNAHVVVEEAGAAEASAASRPCQLILLSAKTPSALDAMTHNLADFLDEGAGSASRSATAVPLADIAFTLQTGRHVFAHRRAVVAREASGVAGTLRARDPKTVVTGSSLTPAPEVVFLFPGQGAQYVGMGRELYEGEPVFRAEVDRCADLLNGPLGIDLREVLYPGEATRAAAERRINETAITQPAIFVIEYALARLWQSWGVKAAVLIGHSIGEYVCAVLAGTFALEDALDLLATRARLMQALPAGSMLAVRLSGAELEPMLPVGASIAATNSAKLCTVSGPTAVLEEFQKALEDRRIASRFLATSHAFHSAMMDPMLPEFTAAALATPREAPQGRWVSTCTGTWMTADDMADAGYWSRQLRQRVRFAEALDAVIGDPRYILLEVGPGQTLNPLARQHPGRATDQAVVASLPVTREPGQESESMLSALGRLWMAGVAPDWKGFYAGEQRRRVPLPTYPFERKRYWAETPPDAAPVSPATAAVDQSLEDTVFAQLAMMRGQLEALAAGRP